MDRQNTISALSRQEGAGSHGDPHGVLPSSVLRTSNIRRNILNMSSVLPFGEDAKNAIVRKNPTTGATEVASAFKLPMFSFKADPEVNKTYEKLRIENQASAGSLVRAVARDPDNAFIRKEYNDIFTPTNIVHMSVHNPNNVVLYPHGQGTDEAKYIHTPAGHSYLNLKERVADNNLFETIFSAGEGKIEANEPAVWLDEQFGRMRSRVISLNPDSDTLMKGHAVRSNNLTALWDYKTGRLSLQGRSTGEAPVPIANAFQSGKKVVSQDVPEGSDIKIGPFIADYKVNSRSFMGKPGGQVGIGYQVINGYAHRAYVKLEYDPKTGKFFPTPQARVYTDIDYIDKKLRNQAPILLLNPSESRVGVSDVAMFGGPKVLAAAMLAEYLMRD